MDLMTLAPHRLPSSVPRLLGWVALLVVGPLVGWSALHSADVPPPIQGSTLNAEGQLALRQHQLLWRMAESATTRQLKQVNDGMTYLHTFVLLDQVGRIDGERIIPLTADQVRIWNAFDELHCTGNDLGKLTAEWRRTAGGQTTGGSLGTWWAGDRDALYYASHLPAAWDAAEGFSLVLRGSGTVSELSLRHRAGGIPQRFDTSPYTTPGADQPVLPVTATIDLTQFRTIDGAGAFEEDRFLRFYADADSGDPAVERHLGERGFVPGRQLLKLRGALEEGYIPGQPKLREDPRRPGHADLSFFDRSDRTLPAGAVRSGFSDFSNAPLRWPGLDQVRCFDDWPSFMAAKVPGQTNARGTPDIPLFDAAVAVAAGYLAASRRDSGWTATWWEVKNESDITEEWTWHAAKDHDGWKLLADFHNQMADRLHATVPGIQVGGPASAWMRYDANDWAVARNHLRFFDATRGRLDFLSFHVYEASALVTVDEQARSGGTSFLLGRLTATLDLNQAHVRAANDRRPTVISEYGAINDGRTASGRWIHLKSVSNLLMQFIERPAEFAVCVPFLIPHTWWEPENRVAVFRPDDHGVLRPSEQARFFDLWRGFRGRRLPSTTDRPLVRTHALLDGRTLWLALNNLEPRRVAVALRGLPTDALGSAEHRRLHYVDGAIAYSVSPSVDARAIPLDVEETAILRIPLANIPVITTTMARQHCYAPQTMLPTAVPAAFTIDLPGSLTRISQATLRIGLGRNGGFPSAISCSFNQHDVTIDLSHAAGVRDWFGTASASIDPTWLSERNQIVIQPNANDGLVTSAVLVIDRPQPGIPALPERRIRYVAPDTQHP